MRRWTVGVDFGGTNVKIGLVGGRGRVMRTAVFATPGIAAPRVFIPAVSRAIDTLARSVGLATSRLRGVGIGAPGLVDARQGIVHHLVNVRGWRGVPLARLLAARLRCPCAVDNDANLVALGEWSFGAGRGAEHLVCVTLGTGVGGGLVLEGGLYRGASGSAGEIGHMIVLPGGRRCGCGQRGCLEAQVGTAAILSEARAAARHGSVALRRLAAASPLGLTPEIVSRAAQAGDAAARQIWVRVGRWLGLAVANAVNLLNPDRVVIGGGVAKAWPMFAPSLLRTVHGLAMDVPGRTVRVVRAKLGDDAGVVGAAVLVWQREDGK